MRPEPPCSATTGVGVSINGSNNTVSENRVFHSTATGILIGGSASSGNYLTKNSVHNNTCLGIDLGADGVTANDAGDGDNGPNNLQNFPVLTSAFSSGGGTLIAGTMNTTPLTQVSIELFSSPAADASGHGEGRVYLGSVAVSTDAAGNASFATVGCHPGARVVRDRNRHRRGREHLGVLAGEVHNRQQSTDEHQRLGLHDQRPAGHLYPASNDTDADVASPQIRTTYQPMGTAPVLTGPGDVAIVSSSGRGYFTGGNASAATDGKIGILNLATNTVVGAISADGQFRRHARSCEPVDAHCLYAHRKFPAGDRRPSGKRHVQPIDPERVLRPDSVDGGERDHQASLRDRAEYWHGSRGRRAGRGHRHRSDEPDLPPDSRPGRGAESERHHVADRRQSGDQQGIRRRQRWAARRVGPGRRDARL